MDIVEHVNPEERRFTAEVVVEGQIWFSQFFPNQVQKAQQQKNLIAGATKLLTAAKRVRDWLDNNLIPHFRRLYNEMAFLDEAITEAEAGPKSKSNVRDMPVVPLSVWTKLCDILSCSPDLPYEDVLAKAEIIAKAWKQPPSK